MKHDIILRGKRLVALLVTICSLSTAWAGELNLIPKPLRVEEGEGHFVLTAKATIGYDAALEEQAEYLQPRVRHRSRWSPWR